LPRRLKVIALGEGRLPSETFKVKGDYSLLVGVLMKKLSLLKVSWRFIEVDGLDGTNKAIEIIEELSPADLILQGSVACAGFNLIDPLSINEKLKVPVIVILREKPDNQAVYQALTKHFKDWKERWRVFEDVAKKAPIIEAQLGEGGPVYVEIVGMPEAEGVSTIKSLVKVGRVPEPLRVAEAIAKGISRSLYSLLKLRAGNIYPEHSN